MAEPEHLADFVAKHRARHGLSQEQLAIRLHRVGLRVARVTIAQIESKRNRPSARLLWALSTILRLDDTELREFVELAGTSEMLAHPGRENQ